MIYSKFIKVICYIAMGFSLIVSVILMFAGIANVIQDHSLIGFGLVLVSLIIPVVSLIALYPTFALANIDENLYRLNEKVDYIIKKIDPTDDIKGSFEENIQGEVELIGVINDNPQMVEKDSLNVSVLTIDFINNKYDTDISIEDTYQVMIQKIQAIDDDIYSAIILKEKVLEAKSQKDVLKILAMHKVVHS